MIRILSLETATDICSVCVSDGKKIMALREIRGYGTHASKLSGFIELVLRESNTEYGELAAVAVTGGPGSYTGLRIGVSAAKGICYALDIPLIAVGTLEAMAAEMKEKSVKDAEIDGIFQPMIDAGRMEVFTAQFDFRLLQISDITSDIIDNSYFQGFPSDKKIICGGNGAVKIKHLFHDKSNIVFLEENIHTSTGVAKVAEVKFLNSDFADPAYFEPFYLKEFIPGKPRVKGLE